jgi:anti-anti-sigma regulatory factor
MNWSKSDHGLIVIYEIAGPISNSGEITRMQESLRDDLNRGCRRFVIDLDRAEVLGSLRLGLFFGMLAHLKRQGAFLVMTVSEDEAANLPILSRLYRLFTCYRNRSHAVAALSS